MMKNTHCHDEKRCYIISTDSENRRWVESPRGPDADGGGEEPEDGDGTSQMSHQ